MEIKDKVVSFYIKHYLIPRAQIVDKPGFVIFNVSGKTPIFARQIIVPESFFILLEKKLVDKFKDVGRGKLYSAGKKFGYRFSVMGGFSKRGEMEDKKLPDYIKMINKFIEGTYASDISCDIYMDKSKVKYSLKNFVVCNKLGYGYFLPLGAAAGMISYLMNNDKIEGVQTKCQGAREERCTLIYEPIEELKKEIKKFKIFTESNLKNLEIDSAYQSMNSIRKTENSNYSFQQFIDSGTFSFKEGIIMNNFQRYFIYEISGIYMLEKELQEDNEMKKILFEAAYETGKEILKNNESWSSLESLNDLLTSFGWGDVLILEKNKKYVVDIKYFPWTKFYESADFIFVRGLLSGLLSIISKREVKLKTAEKSTSEGYFHLFFTE